MWNGPRTVDAVAPAGRSLSRASTSEDRPSTSDRRMNSWRVSSHMCPVRVRNSTPPPARPGSGSPPWRSCAGVRRDTATRCAAARRWRPKMMPRRSPPSLKWRTRAPPAGASRGSNSIVSVNHLLDSERRSMSYPTFSQARWFIREPDVHLGVRSGVFLLQSKVASHGRYDNDISGVGTPRRAPWRNPAVLRRGDGASAVLRLDRSARRDNGARLRRGHRAEVVLRLQPPAHRHAIASCNAAEMAMEC